MDFPGSFIHLPPNIQCKKHGKKGKMDSNSNSSSLSQDLVYPSSPSDCKMASCPGTAPHERDTSSKSQSTESLHKQSLRQSLSESNITDLPLDRISYVCSHHGPKIVSFTDKESCSTAEEECTAPLLADDTSNQTLHKTSEVTLQRGLSSISSESSASFGRLNDSSSIMCRICHCGEEEEKLMITCRCMGTVKYAHQNCVLNWISKSGNQYCELCKYKFKTRRKKVKSLWKWKFPSVSTKGWLHIGLFIAFVTMLLTSITWIVWSRVSSTPTAVAERTTDEVKFAYMLNGLFIALAVGGLYFNSYRHVKRYFQRWSVLNRHMIIEPYCKPTTQGGGEGSSEENATVRPISTTSIAVEITENEGNEAAAASTEKKKKSKGTWV